MVSLYQKVVDMKMSNKLRPLAHRKLIVVTATCLTRARALTVVHPSLQCLQHNTDCGMSGMASGRVLISGQDGVLACWTRVMETACNCRQFDRPFGQLRVLSCASCKIFGRQLFG